jgi:hypothetical protein
MTEPVKCYSCAKIIKEIPIMPEINRHKYCSTECHRAVDRVCTDIGGCPACDKQAIWKPGERSIYSDRCC